MFFNTQPQNNVNEYVELLKIMASLSNLFSDNSKPYLDYRVTENLFCMCLQAKNLSRSDCTADASKDKIGVGIKTFLNTPANTSMQKVAEFNKQRKEYANLHVEELINLVANFRNERIDITKRIHNLTDMIYHCTIRDSGTISIIETDMPKININKIKIEKSTVEKSVIYFNDGLEEYSFNLSKSVLYKRFNTEKPILKFSVDIIENPYNLLKSLFSDSRYSNKLAPRPIKEADTHAFLPLYSVKQGKKYVAEKSGLNQWNANGRARTENEIYIPVRTEFYKKNPDFFPPRDTPFNLMLPDGNIISAKMCQEGSTTDPKIGKSLMSNPNSALGEWILRRVLQLPVGEVVTYEKLNDLGVDSLVIYKQDSENYSIDFTTAGKYESYISEN